MANPIDEITWQSAKTAYLNGSDSLAAIALQFGISKRAVEARAAEEGWSALRSTQTGSKPKPAKPKTTQAMQPLRRSFNKGEYNELEILDDAIEKISSTISNGADPRALGGLASSLVRLLERRRKIKPQTATEIAEMLLALGISPQEFAIELRKAWGEQKA